MCVIRSPLHHLAPTPVVVHGNVRIDCVDVVLPGDREQHASRGHQCTAFIMEKLILDGWLDTDQIEARWFQVQVMTIQPKGKAVERDKLQVEAESSLFIRDVLHDKPGVHEIPVVGVYTSGAARSRVGIVHPPHSTETAEDSFGTRSPRSTKARRILFQGGVPRARNHRGSLASRTTGYS